jgi:IclR family pca regulon transcriptional regulator
MAAARATTRAVAMPPAASAKPPYHVAALARGLAVLASFTTESQELSLTEVARRVRMTKSTTQRFVHTLRDLGYLEQDVQTKRYRPGVRVLELGFAALASMRLPQIALPYLQELHQATGENSSLAVIDPRPVREQPAYGPEVIYAARVRARQLLTIDLEVGSRLPAYSTSVGKVLLAHLPAVELDAILTRIVLPRTGRGTASVATLRAELTRVREQGYAVNDEELAVGLRAVAAPVRNRDGRVVAAINIAVPAPRVSLADLNRKFAPQVVGAADRISASLAASA